MSGMIGPTWLAAIFGVIMLVTAVTSLVSLVVAWRARRATDYDIQIHNLLMGVSMAGMLIPPLLIVTPGPSTSIWLVVWIVITVWFAVAVGREIWRRSPGRPFSGHHVPHLVMSAAMVYMFAVMAGSSMGTSTSSMSGMSGMGGAGGIVPWPTLDYAFVIFMVGYAVIVIDRLPALVSVGGGQLATAGAPSGSATSVSLPLAGTAVTNIVMSITMAYMLTMMFA